MMTIEQLLAIYDDDQRRNMTYPNIQREVTPHVIRHLYAQGMQSFIVYSSLTAENADQIIEGEIDYLTKLGHRFEWKLYAHDTPADLKDRLATHGLQIGEEEAIVVLPLADAPAALFAEGSHEVRRITDPDNLSDIQTIESAVWGDEETKGWVSHLADEMRTGPESIAVYVAYVDGNPASCGWVRFAENSRFASLWGGSTVEQYRGRGVYKALVAARAVEARQRGVDFLNVDASPMSRPILERLGFQVITHSWPCIYNLKA